MLYIAYLPKSKGEKLEERKVNKILNWYMSTTSNDYSVISAPGYFSTSENTIDNFVKNLGVMFNNKNDKKVKIGFLSGMNGHYYTTNGNQIIKICNDVLKKHNFEQIDFVPKQDYDHRKMMCFFKFNDNSSTNISLVNIGDFLQNIYVGALLIGSSNQSFSTYFGKTASKGESDIFLFDCSEDNAIKNYIKELTSANQDIIDYRENPIFNDIVLSQSFYGKGHEDTQNFLKEILRDVLINGLKE